MRRVIYSQQALRDLQAIEDYWRLRDPVLTKQFAAQTLQALEFLVETPSAGASVRGRRKWRIGRTPFLLFYRFDAIAIYILRIRHMSENWRRPS